MQQINPDDDSQFKPRLFRARRIEEPPLARHPWLRLLVSLLVLVAIGLACATAKLAYEVRQLNDKVDQLRPSLLPPWRMP